MTIERVLDWRPNHDPRSRAYGVADVLENFPRKMKMWSPPPSVYDQLNEGACVGFGIGAEAAASPARVKNVDNQFCRQLYQEARAHDRAMGYNWDSGASVLAGAKVMKDRGLWDGYRWSFSIDQVVDALVTLGPVVVGIPWTHGMYETRPSGLVETSGHVVGGHCILLTGYHPKMRIKGEGWFKRWEVVRWRNSWGHGYGNKGDGLIKVEDLARLLADNGEACVPVGRRV